MDELTSMEESLRESLCHVSAPDGFADRVMARVLARDRVHRPAMVPPLSRNGWLAAAAALILSIGSGEALHLRHQHQAQAAAQAEFNLALQLTSHAMNEVQTGFQRSAAGRYAKLWNGN